MKFRLPLTRAKDLSCDESQHRIKGNSKEAYMMAQQKVVRPGVIVSLLFLMSLVFPQASAQLPQRQPTPNDALISPEVLPDHRVTLRIYAPKASEVIVRGDWMETPGSVKLEKSEKGVWSATVGPLVPDFYSYSFTV